MTIEQLYQLYRQNPVICTDTRKLTGGCLFFALKGDNFDGNQFAQKALDAGAGYAIIDDPEKQTDPRCILVLDVLTTLQQLAKYHRLKFDIPLIGIGGSNGKTTTKELIASILGEHYPCHFTKGNLNNHIGVPITLLEMPLNTEVAVIEMGTNQPGDVALLCDIAAPTHGLITNIGKEHLAGFGNIEGVKKAEGELYDYITKHQGILFVNADEKYLSAMSKRSTRRIFYSGSQNADIGVVMETEMPTVTVRFQSDEGTEVQVKTNLYGRHNFNNIMTAIALAIYFKVPAQTIKKALESYHPSNNRSQLIHYKKAVVLLDAYNANPSSMRPALQSLKAMPAQKRMAVLGDMLELGADSIKEHRSIVALAKNLKIDRIILVGNEFGAVFPEKDNRFLHFSDNTSAKAWIDTQDLTDTLILIKGSRGIRLEKLIQD